MRRAVTAYPHASVIPAKAGVQKAKNWVPAFAGTSGRGVAFALLFFGLGLHGAHAQDVRGLEVCTAEKQMERRTGCLQANIDYLMNLIDRNARDSRQKLEAAGKDLAAAKNEVTTLKASLAAMQARIEKLEKPEKPEKPKSDAK